MSQVTIAEAAALTNRSRETINYATRQGRLSYSRNAQKWKVVELSELDRVFPLVKTLDELREEEAAENDGPAPPADAALKERLRHSESVRQSLAEERERERRQLTAEIESLRESLERAHDCLRKSQDEHGRALLMLTDQSQTRADAAANWESTLRRLETRIANETQEQLSRLKSEHQAEVARLRQTLAEQPDRPFWRRLFD